MIWVNCIFGLLLFTAITCSPAKSHGDRQLAGAPVEKNPKDPKYLELANLSMKKYKSIVESKHDFVVFEVTKATEQVVAGFKTKIEFYALEISRQSPNGHVSLKSLLLCDSSILEQPWLPKTDITVDCEPEVASM